VNPQVRILRRSAAHGIAVASHTLVVHWRTKTGSAAVDDLTTLLSEFANELGRVALVQVIHERATPPDGAACRALATMLKRNERRLVGSAVVFEGAGFRISMVRAIVLAISTLARIECPHTTFGSTAAAIEWLTALFGDGCPHATDGVQLAIDRLRARPS